MSRTPELPDFIRDLEIAKSLEKLSPNAVQGEIDDELNDAEIPNDPTV
jgi:hypothetical protein